MYDENDSIEYIRQQLGDAIATYDDDQLLNVIDAVWDWQEEHGFLDVDGDEDPDAESVAADVVKLLRKDAGCLLSPELITRVVVAELEFENTL